MAQEMTTENIHWFLDLFEELGVVVWLDGGWGVDALLGEQTRPHADLDIMVPTLDSVKLVEALRRDGFEDVHTDDRVDENFVMGHQVYGRIDFHIFELFDDGHGVYRPDAENWPITAEELAGTGSIDGRSVRCLSAEYMVRSHADYTLKSTDVHDMSALRERFGVKLLDEQVQVIEFAVRNPGKDPR